MDQVLVLGIVIACFVDPGEHSVDLGLVVTGKEGSPMACQIVAVNVSGVKNCIVSLLFLLLVAANLIQDVVEVEIPHILPELVYMRVTPFSDIVRVHVDQGDVGDAADPTTSFEALENLLVAKHCALPQVL